MNNFVQRTIFGALYVAIVVVLLWIGPLGLLVLLLVVGFFALYEFLKLQKAFSPVEYLSLCVLHTLLVFHTLQSALFKFEWTQWLIPLFAIWAIAHAMLLIRKLGANVYGTISTHFFSLLYISLPLALFASYSTGEGEYNFYLPLLGFILVWSSDTFAYISGKLAGRNPLFPSLSPGKTIEGLVGGTLLTAAMGAFLCWIWDFGTYWPAGLALGVVVSMAGTAGDLFESALKRQAGVKDSGNIIPGHGGILDRFDAFLFVSVVLWVWGTWLGF
jgi:phosphatidate cytidylyltransferase